MTWQVDKRKNIKTWDTGFGLYNDKTMKVSIEGTIKEKWTQVSPVGRPDDMCHEVGSTFV